MIKDLIYKNRKTILPFEEDGSFFIYNGRKGMLFNVPEIIYYIFKSINLFDKQYNEERFLEFLGVKYEANDIKNALKQIKELNKQYEPLKNVVYEAYNREKKRKYITGLWLNIAHDCNLKCSYCYADCGTYGGKAQLMTKNTAKKCINHWFDKIDKTKKRFNIVFFGGEPLVNKEVLIYSVNEINKLLKNIGARAKYTMTTNGTILDYKLIDFLKENDFDMSVSIDGLELIHNRNRPYVSGKNSYKDVLRNTKILLKIFPEMVVNMVVKKEDISFMESSVEHLWNHGIKFVNIALCIDKDEILNYTDLLLYKDQIKSLANKTSQNIIKGNYKSVNNIIETIVDIRDRKNNGKCSLYNNKVLVFAANGDIYKCYKTIGEVEYKISNVNEENIDFCRKNYEKQKINECENCWAQALCNDGCPIENKLYTGDIDLPSDINCAQIKIIKEESIRMYSKMLVSNNKELNNFFMEMKI
ncbi:radical SAM protein [Clostridiaceae bacterium M8S5]|nr:radical SAM protein [Clostridiaceae bacterium M8S5]